MIDDNDPSEKFIQTNKDISGLKVGFDCIVLSSHPFFFFEKRVLGKEGEFDYTVGTLYENFHVYGYIVFKF